MSKDNSTGKNKEFYELGKKLFDSLQHVKPHSGDTIKYKDLFPKDYDRHDMIIKELQDKIDQALVHLQLGTEVDVLEAIRILK